MAIEDLDDLFEYLTQSSKALGGHPVFLAIHFLTTSMMVREDFPDGNGPSSFFRQHPLASYVGTMLLGFGGTIIGHFVLGESVLLPFAGHFQVGMATVCWYAVHYTPRDIVFNISRMLPSKVVIIVGKEIHRALSVQHGILFAIAKHPGAYLLVILYSVIKGSGAVQMRILQRLVCGEWSPTSVEFMKPTLTTKTTVVASVWLLLDYCDQLTFSHDLAYLIVVVFFIATKLLYLFKQIDCFEVLENAFCYVFFGGLVDDIEQHFSTDGSKLE